MLFVHLNLPDTEMGCRGDEIDYKKIHSTVPATNSGDADGIPDERAVRRQRAVIGCFANERQ